jgi:SSS family solute:Na+ symporter
MAIAADLKPTFPLAFAGWTFPGYSAMYTVVLNLLLVLLLTPLFNAITAHRGGADETLPADYHA